MWLWQEEDQKGTSMKADELLEILKEDKESKRDEAQSGVISDKARPCAMPPALSRSSCTRNCRPVL